MLPISKGYKWRNFKQIRHDSPKAWRAFVTKSSYEHRLALALDKSPNVISYGYEPMRVSYVHQGRMRSYMPDFVVCIAGMVYVLEVKPKCIIDMHDPVDRSKWTTTAKWCRDKFKASAMFLLVDEEALASIEQHGFLNCLQTNVND